MANKAVVDREPIVVERLEERSVHAIDLGLGKQSYVVDCDSELDIQRIHETTEMRRVVLASEFTEILERSSGHEVFPDKVIAPERSAHQVGFGRFIGRRPSKGNRVGNLTSTALKPFNNASKATQEFVGYGILKRAGIPTFEPIGIFPADEGNHLVVVTKKRDDLMSLDRDEWIVGRQPKNIGEVEIAQRNTQTIKEIAGVMALMSSLGIEHPDGQIKNFAITTDGKVGVIDTENLSQLPGQEPSDLATKAWRDIEKLVKSLIMNENVDEGGAVDNKIFGVGMLSNMNLLTVRQSCDELIFRPFLEALDRIMLKTGYRDDLVELGIMLYENFEKSTDWPNHLIKI